MQVRSLKTNKAKAVIVAHNVERIESENGLDDVVAQLHTLLEALPVGAAALGLGSLESMPDALDGLL